MDAAGNITVKIFHKQAAPLDKWRVLSEGNYFLKLQVARTVGSFWLVTSAFVTSFHVMGP